MVSSLKRAAFTMSLLVRPQVFREYVGWYLADRLPGAAASPREKPRGRPISFNEALARLPHLHGAPASGPAIAALRQRLPAVAELSANAAPHASVLAGDSSLGELLYALVRAVQPDLVVETGVAQGITSAHIAAGLEDNGHGRLESIDLPPTALVVNRLVGVHMPPSLRRRWHYHWGSATRLLPQVLRRARPDIFVHDSDHRYHHMRWELACAWDALPPGGWVVADDVDLHTAFEDFCREVEQPPLCVQQQGKPGWTGVVQKPA